MEGFSGEATAISSKKVVDLKFNAKFAKLKEELINFSFILPSFITFLTFMIYPIVYSLFISFMDWNMFLGLKGSKFVGLHNYFEVFKNEYFLAGLKNNLIFSCVAVPLLLVLSLFFATLLNQKIHGRGLLRAIYFMPYIATVTAAAVVFKVMFHPTFGPVNGVLRQFGIENPPLWTASSKYALFTIALFWVWKNIGYCVVIYLAGLQGIPKTLYEAAAIDGANTWQKFRHVTLPLITPTTFFLAITNIIFSFQLFPEVQIMTDGGPGNSTMTMVFHMYREGFEKFNLGYASAVSWVFFIIILCITAIQWYGQKKWVSYV